jgi:hypothetical protein
MSAGDIWRFHFNLDSPRDSSDWFSEGELLLELECSDWKKDEYVLWSLKTKTIKKIGAGALRNFAGIKYKVAGPGQ